MAGTRGDTRARILDTAWGLVRERGIGAVTVADIAAATGVSRQLLYVHFENRAGLLVAMARRHDVRSGFAGRAAETRSLPWWRAGAAAAAGSPTSPRSCPWPGRWRRPPPTATRAGSPGATAWATCGSSSRPPSSGSRAPAAWPRLDGPRPPTGSGPRPARAPSPPGRRPRLARRRLRRPRRPLDPGRGRHPRLDRRGRGRGGIRSCGPGVPTQGAVRSTAAFRRARVLRRHRRPRLQGDLPRPCYGLVQRNRLDVPIIGVARSGWDLADLRSGPASVEQPRQEQGRRGGVRQAVALLDYIDGDYADTRPSSGCARPWATPSGRCTTSPSRRACSPP